jgi:hypothetical protein
MNERRHCGCLFADARRGIILWHRLGDEIGQLVDGRITGQRVWVELGDALSLGAMTRRAATLIRRLAALSQLVLGRSRCLVVGRLIAESDTTASAQ